MGLAFQSKDYDTAIEYGTRLTRSGHGDPQVFTTIGQSYFLKENFAESARFFRSLIDEQIKRGQKPIEQNLIMLHSSYEKTNNKEGVAHALETLVVYYPKPQYWDAMLFSVRNNPELEPREKLQVYRLMSATGTLKLGSDYSRYAELAQQFAFYAEAQRVYTAGLEADVFTSDTDQKRAERLRDSVAKSAEAERTELPKLANAAAASGNAEDSVVVGMAYYSFDEPAKAIEALQNALATGGLKDDLKAEVTLVIGMAQLRARDKAAALNTFRSISTDNPKVQQIAKLWALYAS
jgi:tetratricopeptide (TPR) repeat protein